MQNCIMTTCKENTHSKDGVCRNCKKEYHAYLRLKALEYKAKYPNLTDKQVSEDLGIKLWIVQKAKQHH